MKRWIFALAVVLLFVVACGPKVPEYELEDDVAIDMGEPVEVEQAPVTEPVEAPVAEEGRKPPAMTPPSEHLESTKDVEPAPAPEPVDPELRGLLKLPDEKVKSYSFLYGGPDTNYAFEDTYIIKGDKIKVQRYEEDYYIRDNETTHWYVDTEAKTAFGCCETRNRCVTPKVDYTNTLFDLDYDKFMADMPKTPYQWLKEIPKDAQIKGHETFNTRSVTIVEYNLDDGSKVHMKLDETYGLPHQVVITRDEQQVGKYQFNDLNFNSWKDADFVPPCA